MIGHHPSDELLLDHASGSASEAVSLCIATHLDACCRCQREVARLEAIGGSLLEAIEPDEDVELDEFTALLAKLDKEPASAPPAVRPALDAETCKLIPSPLHPYLPAGLRDLPWRRAGRSLETIDLATTNCQARVQLMRIAPGAPMPVHTHEGQEYTVVLAGGFSDDHGHYERGDFAIADPSREHKPVADPGEPCLCLAMTDAPLRLTGPVGRLLNPFVDR